MKYKRIESTLAVQTDGLLIGDQRELRASISDRGRLVECEGFLKYVADYLTNTGSTLKAGETIQWGYWHVKFELASDGILDAFEHNPDWSAYIRGISLAASYVAEQHATCAQNGEEMCAPPAHYWCMVSGGVLEDEPVDGARYAADDEISGWYLTTEKYDGNVTSMRWMRLYEVTSVRPDVARYLALPHGYWFNQRDDNEPIGFDAALALRLGL